MKCPLCNKNLTIYEDLPVEFYKKYICYENNIHGKYILNISYNEVDFEILFIDNNRVMIDYQYNITKIESFEQDNYRAMILNKVIPAKDINEKFDMIIAFS